MTDLRALLNRYRCENLKNVDSSQFKNTLLKTVGEIDPTREGFEKYETDSQRDLSIKFHWGHNHDFGDFFMSGRMGDRHIELLENFIDLFPIDIEGFTDAKVLDIGCWTGGTSLLLSALASEVVAVEEVRKYAMMTRYLANAFGIEDKLTVRPCSLYQLNTPDWENCFDIVNFPGVIYHLTDPILALRIIYNTLHVGGLVLVESKGINSEKPICRFEGSLLTHSGTKEELNRGGWNWFVPSPSALSRMMQEAGFDEVHSIWHKPTGRIYAFAQKLEIRGICKAGLSVPDIS